MTFCFVRTLSSRPKYVWYNFIIQNAQFLVMAKKTKKEAVSALNAADKIILIHLLQEQVCLLKDRNKRLEVRLKTLENKLSKNSSNSSKPPSSDKHNSGKKPKKTTSSRKKSGLKPGGQPGHKGHTLEMRSKPDEVITLPVDSCVDCHRSLKNTPAELEKRQVFEIPEPKIWVSEYQAQVKYCKHCDCTTVACFPEHVTHTAQYGPRAKGLMVYMTQYQLLPYKRASEFFKTIYNHRISEGTIVNAVNALSNRLEHVEGEIKALLIKSNIAHADETGMNVNGDKQWLHTVGTKILTHYAIHKKRGRDGMDDIGILPKFNGTLIHDHWKSYYSYALRHGLCNSHHLRELRFIFENHSIKWANKVSRLLIEINEHKERLVAKKQVFTKQHIKDYSTRYDEILSKAKWEQARKATVESTNLLKRLKNFKDDVLLFMTDMDVPFTNNLSEQDIRMMKVKQKISGCFRHIDGGTAFCRIRSVISTAKKNKKNIFEILQVAFQKRISVDYLLTSS